MAKKGFGQYIDNSSTARVRELKKKIEEQGSNDPEDLMLIIMELFTEEVLYPEPGKFYTFVYRAKTPEIQYDQHPLILAGGPYLNGFIGFNYHLGKIRQYNTADGDRLVSGLYELSQQEFATLRSVPYRKLIQN